MLGLGSDDIAWVPLAMLVLSRVEASVGHVKGLWTEDGNLSPGFVPIVSHCWKVGVNSLDLGWRFFLRRPSRNQLGWK